MDFLPDGLTEEDVVGLVDVKRPTDESRVDGKSPRYAWCLYRDGPTADRSSSASSLDSLAKLVLRGDHSGAADLHAAGAAGVAAVMRAYQLTGGRDETERLDAVLVGFGAVAVPLLIEGLHEPIVERAAASALGLIGDRSAVGPLIEATTSDDPFVRSSATRALGRLRDKRALRAIVARLDEPDARLFAIEALVRLRDKRAIPALRRYVDDPVPGVAKYARDAIRGLETRPRSLLRGFADGLARMLRK